MTYKGRSLRRIAGAAYAVLLSLSGAVAGAQDFQATQVRFDPTVQRAVDIEVSRFGSFTAIADWSDGNSVRLLDESWQLLWKHRQQVFWAGTFRHASLLQFAPDESFLIYPAYRTDNDIAVVDTRTGEPLAVLTDHDATVVSLGLSSDGKRLVSATNAQLFLWRRNGKGYSLVDRIAPYKPAIRSIALSPDGSLVAVTETEGVKRRLVVYDISSGRFVRRQVFENEDRNLSREYNQLVFSPDGRWIAAGYSDSLRLWNRSSDSEQHFRLADELERIELGPVYSVRFSPDGRLLLTGHSRDIRVWRIEDGKWARLSTFTPHHGHVVDLAFSADGTKLALAGTADSNGAGLWSTSGAGSSALGEVLSSLAGRISAGQRRLLTESLAKRILSGVPAEYTTPRDMFETKEEYAARRASARRSIASRLQEETERAYAAERAPLAGALYRVSVPLQSQGSYQIESRRYQFEVMDSPATVHLERDTARKLFQGWRRARLIASRFDTPDGPAYADFRLAIPGVDEEFPIGLKENPFTGERLDEFGARVPVVSVGPALLVRDLEIDGIFPTLARHYAASSLGSATVQNVGSTIITNLAMSLYIPGRMQVASPSRLPTALGVGQSVRVTMPALLDTKSLGSSAQESVSAEITVSYSAGGEPVKGVITRPIGILNCNAIRWDDDRKIAAFMTTTDPALLRYSGQIVGMVDDTETNLLTRSYLTAIRLFSAMRVSGIHYVVDPRSSYESLSRDKSAIDFVRFPVETLDAQSGDCDDLSVLYNALLESVGVSTAFITTPGHIFTAFDSGVPAELLDRFTAKPEEVILHDGNIWIPVETTALDQGFMKAWQIASVEWRQARSGANFFTTSEAWKTYPSTGLSSAASAAIPPSGKVVQLFSSQLAEYRTAALAPRESELEQRLERTPSPALENQLGILYAQFGLFDRALKRFEQATEGAPYLPALINAASILSLKKEHESARELLMRAVDIEPKNAHVLVRLAYSYYQGGNEQEARKTYERMSKIDPALADRFPLFGPGDGASGSQGRAAKAGSGATPFSGDWIAAE